MDDQKASSYKILNFIVHEVFWVGEDKNKVAGNKLRSSENSPNKLSSAVVSKLAKLFEETSLASGMFSSENAHRDGAPAMQPTFFQVSLKNSYKNKSIFDFVTFTRHATEIFKRDHWGKAKTAKAGYLLFYHYTVNSSHFLAVVMLHKTLGIKLDEQLALEEVDQLDLSTLHLATRINLSIWRNPDKINNRYIKFRLGKSASDMRQFFTDFIGCNEYTEQKEDTTNLIAAIEAHCLELSYSSERSNKILEEASSFCRDEVNRNDEGQIKLVSIANKLFPDDPVEFNKLAQGDPFNLNDQFGIHERSLSKFVRLSGRSKNLNVSFLRSALDNELIFNRQKQQLVITKIPSDLLVELNILTSAKPK